MAGVSATDSGPVAKWALAFGVVFAVVAVVLSGCNVGDLVTVDVPPEVQKTTGAEPRVTFNESEYVYTDYIETVQKNAERFQAERDKKAELVSLLTSLGNDAIVTGIPVLETLPGGAMLSTALVGLGAWFLPKPGSAKAVQNEKQASYNAGLKKGAEAAKATA